MMMLNRRNKMTYLIFSINIPFDITHSTSATFNASFFFAVWFLANSHTSRSIFSIADVWNLTTQQTRECWTSKVGPPSAQHPSAAKRVLYALARLGIGQAHLGGVHLRAAGSTIVGAGNDWLLVVAPPVAPLVVDAFSSVYCTESSIIWALGLIA